MLVKCPECSKEVSDQAPTCPNCGYSTKPPPKPKSAAGMTGCGIVIGIVALLVLFNAVFGDHSTTSSTSDATVADACAPSNFLITKEKATERGGYATLTGIVRNNCDQAKGIRLKWTAYNKDGSVAFSDTFWPASTTNIPPHSDYPFETMNKAPRGPWTFVVVPEALEDW